MDTQVTSVDQDRLQELREIVAEVLERDAEEITDTGDFRNEYDADSMRAIEILSRLEKKYRVDIPQAALPEMQNLKAVYSVVARHGGWKD
jgi:acyl carrier protein